jgi:hypothetical protein
MKLVGIQEGYCTPVVDLSSKYAAHFTSLLDSICDAVRVSLDTHKHPNGTMDGWMVGFFELEFVDVCDRDRLYDTNDIKQDHQRKLIPKNTYDSDSLSFAACTTIAATTRGRAATRWPRT